MHSDQRLSPAISVNHSRIQSIDRCLAALFWALLILGLPVLLWLAGHLSSAARQSRSSQKNEHSPSISCLPMALRESVAEDPSYLHIKVGL